MIRIFSTSCSDREIALVESVLRSGELVMGKHVRAFEAALDDYIGSSLVFRGGSVTCASGTDALVLALEEMKWLYKGDRVIVPAMSFSATYEAVLRAGFEPLVCDIHPEHLTLDSLDVNRCFINAIDGGDSVAGIILVHLYGWPAYDTVEIANFCRAAGIFLIEDCAQCFGAELDRQKCGTFGDAAAFSFYPTKPLGGIGDGGAVYFSRSKDFAVHAAARRNHGRDGRGVQSMAGYNSRLDEANAAVLHSRLLNHDAAHEYRRALSGRYHFNGLKKLSFKRKGRGIPYVYPILVPPEWREGVRFELADRGVETRVHYDPPISQLPYVQTPCPNAEKVARSVLSLPCHQGMTPADVDVICVAIREAISGREVNQI